MPDIPNGPGAGPEQLPHALGAWVAPREDKDPKRIDMRHFLVDEHREAVGGTAVFHQIPEWALDQANTSSCVGQCGRGWELGYPDPYPDKPADHEAVSTLDEAKYPAIADYFGAQRNDPWPGGEYGGASPQYEGSSLSGLDKYLRSSGKIQGATLWAKSARDVIDWLRLERGVMFASRWHRDMFRPDQYGFIHPAGAIDGGHAYFLFGVDEQDNVYIHNSWGDSWGLRNQFYYTRDAVGFRVAGGVAKINPSDLQALFSDGDAEGFSPAKTQAGPTPPPLPEPGAYYPALPRISYTALGTGTRYTQEAVLTKRDRDIGHYIPKPKGA